MVFWTETYRQLELCDEVRSEVKNLVIEKLTCPLKVVQVEC